MNGANITGGRSYRGRAENDFYATNPKDVNAFLTAYIKDGGKIAGKVLEPCIGQGHIAKVLKERFGNFIEIEGMDIVDRGCGFPFEKRDFIMSIHHKKYDWVITNPPYSIAEPFIRTSLEVLNSGGHCAMFLKLQFLEGEGRKGLFRQFPPKYIYVHRKRAQPLRNGSEIDPETNRKWQSSTICFAWFVWEKGWAGEPVIRWC